MATDALLDAVRHLADQVRESAVAAADLDGLPERDGITEVAIIGVGPGRVAGDVIEALAELSASVPVVATGGVSPSWVGPSTLAIAVSQSGNEVATVNAARAAREAGGRVVAVTSGGDLLAACAEWDAPAVRVDPESGPAAGLAVAIVPSLVVLERLGLATGMSRIISSTAEQLDRRRLEIEHDRTPIEAIAADLPDRVAIVCGAGAVGKHAARRWVQELDRVGGIPAVRRRLPTGAEDAETWARLHDRVVSGVTAIVLRHDFEPEGLTAGHHLIEEAVASTHEVHAQGDGPFAQMLDLVLVGDAVAAVMAASSAGADER